MGRNKRAGRIGGAPLGADTNIRLDYTDTKRQVAGVTRTKVTVSGTLFEVNKYEHPIRYGYKSKKARRRRMNVTRAEEHRKKTLIRALNRVRQLAHLNFTENDKFLTLTFKNENNFDINNLAECLPYYQEAMRRMRRKYKNLKYVTVAEFQQRGAVHYHMLCNIPFIQKSELEEIWPYGFSKVLAIKGTSQLAFYLCKYLGKKFDDLRKHGHRLFYTSQNLDQPKVIYTPVAEDIRTYLEKTTAVQYEKEYDSEYNGKVTHRQYIKEKNK